jgi:hypothetical protein
MRLKAVESLHPQRNDGVERYLAKCPAFDPEKLDFQERHGIQFAIIAHGWIILKGHHGLVPFSPKMWRAFIDMAKRGELDNDDMLSPNILVFINACTPEEHSKHRAPENRFT